MTGVIATIPRTQFFDTSGKPLAGGKLQTYLAGTTTPVKTYQDQALTIFNETAIPLDAVGSCTIWLDPDKSYKFVLKDKKGVTVPGWPVDNISGASNPTSLAPTLAEYTKQTAIAAAVGSSLMGHVQAGANAVARTAQSKMRERVSVEDFVTPAMGDDWTLAFKRAVASLPNGGVVEYTTSGMVNISDVIVTSDTAPIVFKGKGSCTAIKKMFNGDMFNLGKRSELRDLKLDGNGATYTGRGVICTTGAVDLVSWRRFDKVEMVNMKGFPIEFTTAIAGYGSVISHSYLGAVDGTTAGVKLPDLEPNGNRQMINVFTSGPMFHAAGCNNHYAQGCEGGAPVLLPTSVKVRMNSCRIPYSVSTPNFDVDGVDTLVADCEIGVAAINFKATLSSCNWYGNDDTGAAPVITDLSNGSNRIQIKRTLYTPTWAASGAAITPGNASIGGAWSREGDRCAATGTLSFGSASVVAGSNTWTMTTPYKAARNEVGSIWVQQTGTGLKQYAGSCIITAGTNTIQFNVAGATSAVGDGVPAAWSANDLLIWNIEYFIQ